MEIKHKKAIPVLNMNGDTATTLMEQWQAVNDAARELQNALNAAAPHGRNYQTYATDEPYNSDRAMSELMIQFARNVRSYAHETQMHIYEQMRG